MIGIVAGVVVGLALIAAGVFKFIEGPAWPKQAVDMGVSRPVAQVVPFVEVIIGGLLLSQLLKPWPAIAALALLIAFTVVVIRRLLDGSRPPCACFGSRSKRPLGGYHILRNLGLLALTVVAVVWA